MNVNKNKFIKKSISPLISMVLIILVVVILIGIFSTWSEDSTTKKLEETSKNIPSASEFECLNSNLDIKSCYIDPTTNHIKLLVNNPSNLDYKGLSLSLQARDDSNNDFKITGIFDTNLPAGTLKYLNTYKDFYFIKQDRLFSTIDVNKVDLITLASRTCPNKVLNITDCNKYSTLNEALVGHWLLDQDSEILGPELYVGNEFDNWGSDSYWTILNNIEGGVELESNTTGNSLIGSDLSMTTGQADNAWFKVQADVNVNSIDNGYIRVYLGSANGGYPESNSFKIYNSGIHNIDFLIRKKNYIDQHPDNILEFSTATHSNTTANYKVTNISVKQLQTKDFSLDNDLDIYGSYSYSNYTRGDVNKVFNFVSDNNNFLEVKETNLFLDNWSISFWAKGDIGSLFASYDTGTYDYQSGFVWRAEYGCVEGKAIDKTWGSPQITDDWRFYTITLKRNHKNGFNFYINTVLEKNMKTYDYITSFDNIIIGNRFASGNHFFNGSISDFRLYNKVLSTQEIEELYYTTKNRYIVE
jgi:FlaG/FlaF family flagellin (archaellin)